MGSRKTGRKMKSAYKRHKDQLKSIESLRRAAIIASQAITAAQMEAIRLTQQNKCIKCVHSFEENKEPRFKAGGIVGVKEKKVDFAKDVAEQVLNGRGPSGDITIDIKDEGSLPLDDLYDAIKKSIDNGKFEAIGVEI